MVKDAPFEHERTAEVYRARTAPPEKCQIGNIDRRLYWMFIACTAPPENVRNEAEETRLYWQNSVLESTKDYALTKA